MTYNFVTINVRDMDRSVSFYREVLGFTVARSFSPAPGTTITFLKDDAGHELEFIEGPGREPYSGKGISLGFYVKDLEETERLLKSRDVRIVSGPIVLKSGVRLLDAQDPDGFELGFVQQP